MTKPDDAALIPSPGKALSTPGTRPSRILDRMAGDVLAVSQDRDLTAAARHRLGNHDFREADYRQILEWAAALGMTPEALLAILEPLRVTLDHDQSFILAEFMVADGRIEGLVWDFDLLPLTLLDGLAGLSIRRLAFTGTHPTGKPGALPSTLESFHCTETGLGALDLSSVPQLQVLGCSYNQLTELDLSFVPNLQILRCDTNQLTELDLSSVPQLQELDCSENQLTELDLSYVPNLQRLWCDINQLTELDLSSVPNLLSLGCSYNQLTELDLSSVPNLQRLYCSENQLTELDLSFVPQLRELDCADNQLTELDLSSLSQLQKLDCSGNPLTELDLTPVPEVEPENLVVDPLVVLIRPTH